MKLNHAQKVFLKFVAISQLYVALAVLALVAYGAVIKLPWETSWMFVLATFLVCEAAAVIHCNLRRSRWNYSSFYVAASKGEK